MARRLLIVLAATAAFAGGCGGGSGSGNGEADKSANEILADARSAATKAGSVHVTGTIVDSGTRLKLNLHAGDATGTGTISFKGSPIEVIRIGTTLYMKAPASFYTSTGADTTTAALLDRKWLKASAKGQNFAELAQLTRLKDLLTLTTKPDGKISKGSESTIDGTKVIEVKDDKGGSLFIATTGDPVPVALRGKDSTSSGNVHFTEWGDTIEAKAPKGAVDLGKVGG